MSTAAQLQTQIEAARRLLEERRQLLEQTEREIDDADERQRLRRVLDGVNTEIAETNQDILWNQQYSGDIDRDRMGVHLQDRPETLKAHSESSNAQVRQSESVTCNAGVAEGKYLWKIKGLSWLIDALNDRGRVEADEATTIAGTNFDFWYTPAGGRDGTLAIEATPVESKQVTLRYQIFVKRTGGDFVPWGNPGKVCVYNESLVFGPDVPSNGHPPSSPQGIFGLSHDALLNSEWVDDDVLTVKFELHVRPRTVYQSSGVHPLQPLVTVPPTTIIADFSSLLETGNCSDVTLIVGDTTIKAHSQILCARSDVFDRLLRGGMSESISKEIVVEDCDACTLKALLHFIYTDDLLLVEKLLRESQGPSISAEMVTDGKDKETIQRLRRLLVVSHRYQISRLHMWCEQQLCDCITVDGVCSILCQAHLLDATQLQNACLNFVRQHYQKVVVAESFGALTQEWPAVMLKINLFMAGVSEASAATAIEAHRHVTKRKRDE